MEQYTYSYTGGEFRTRRVECAGGLHLRVGPGKGGSESQQARRLVRRGCYVVWRPPVNEYARPRPFRG